MLSEKETVEPHFAVAENTVELDGDPLPFGGSRNGEGPPVPAY